MISLVNGVSMLLKADRSIDYTEIEQALHAGGFTSGYTIGRTDIGGQKEFQIAVFTPPSEFHDGNMPRLDAIQTLTAVAEVIRKIEAGSTDS